MAILVWVTYKSLPLTCLVYEQPFSSHSPPRLLLTDAPLYPDPPFPLAGDFYWCCRCNYVLWGWTIRRRKLCWVPILCPGTYNPDSQNPVSSCRTAQAGSYSCGPDSGPKNTGGSNCYGATNQVSCGSGYHSAGGAGSCTICLPGSFCSSANSVAPQLCSPGQYQPNPGATSTCPNCPVGTYNWINGAIACCPCCAGTYNDQPGQTHCFSCHQHTNNPQVDYSPVGATGVGQCQATPIAGVSNDPDACTNTPSGITNPPPGSATCPATQSGMPPSPSHINKRSKMPVPCAKGQKRCFQYVGMGGFECVDIDNDPYNCGGCVGVGLSEQDEDGQDCTAIPGVSVVKCLKRNCVIVSRMRGFHKAKDGESCQPILRSLQA
ncbi:hypothetical protein FRB94_007260 [Tulasnella sp. JGI-2019a]|nr:hypothetical protein FRB94_007260 [Tulasnella sp. JGI-2019a]